jgi:hypothetical protein
VSVLQYALCLASGLQVWNGSQKSNVCLHARTCALISQCSAKDVRQRVQELSMGAGLAQEAKEVRCEGDSTDDNRCYQGKEGFTRFFRARSFVLKC